MKYILLIPIVFNFILGSFQEEEISLIQHQVVGDSTLQHKLNAFNVLQTNCNVCHEQRNRNAVFTLNNMNAWGAKINEQVFIKMRMPKGNMIVLTNTDKEKLKKWIRTLK